MSNTFLLARQHTDADGNVWKLGNIPAAPRLAWPEFGQVPKTRLIPRAEWKGLLQGMDTSVGDIWNHPIADQNGYGMCFPAGTLIRMADGSQKPIEQVRTTDMVLTAEGRIRRVVKTMVREEKSAIYHLKVWGHRHLRATAEHPILTERGYVKMADLTSDDFVAFPKFAPIAANAVQTAHHLEGRKYVARESVRGIPGKRSTTTVTHVPPDAIHLDYDFGWIVGLFLAEGSTSSGKSTWTLGLDEVDTHAATLVRLLRESLHIEANVRTKESNHTTLVTVYGSAWARLFEAWCDSGAKNKQLSPELTEGNLDFLRGVLDGWSDGDGLGDEYNGGVTISHVLAVQMFDIANRLGYMPTIETLDVKTYGRVKSRQKRYIVRWGKCPEREDHRRHQDASNLWRRVDSVAREDYSGLVYNFEVEDDHSYVAEGVGVHNCNCSGTATAIEKARARQGLPYVQLSGGDLYRRIAVGGRDNGSLLEDGLREAMENGVASTDVVPYLDWQRDYGQAAVQSRKKYRVLEAYLCPTFDHAFSAALLGFPLILGIMWYDNFRVDSLGWLPRQGSGGAGGHAFCGDKPAERNGFFGIACSNSWTPQWGARGRFAMPEDLFGREISGTWAIGSVVTEDGDVPAPKK